MDAREGGPAFPARLVGEYKGGTSEVYEPGMSLRDYFAGQALIGLMSTSQSVTGVSNGTTALGASLKEGFAIMAYGYADELLKARARSA